MGSNLIFKLFIRKVHKQKQKLSIIAVFLVITVTILKTDLSPDLYFINFYVVDNTTCYTITEGDSLPAIDPQFIPPVKSIHFLETSCNGLLNSRQACAVESAAIVHPDWQVNVFFVGPVSKENLEIGSMKILKKYNNIKLFRLNILEFAVGTPLEDFVRGGALNRTRYKVSHTSDALRYISLYKWGGVYLDLDVVVARSFNELAMNWAARESDVVVSAGAISFSRDVLGRFVAEVAIRDFKNNYRGDAWPRNGPGVMTRILRKICSTKTIVDMSTKTCRGIEVYGPELFYPVALDDYVDYFKSKELNIAKPYTYHLWNHNTRHFRVTKDSVYAKLAKKYCPKVYEAFGDNFGA